MKTFESQLLSAVLHGAFLIFVVYYFVPPKVIQQGQGMLIDLVSAPSPKGQKVKAPKVAKSKKEVMSKPVVIATKPKKKKVARKSTPTKKVKAPVQKDVQQKAVITQKEKSIAEVPKVKKPAENVKIVDSAKDRLKKATDQKKESAQDALVSRSTGKKPAPPAAAPIVGEKKYSLAEAMGTEDGVKDARKLTQQPGNIPPTYPMSDRLENTQGKVILVAYVNGTGQVEDIKVEDSTGSFLMEAASVRAFSKYRFSENQPGWVRMPFEFQLKGPAKEMHAQVEADDEAAFEEAAVNEEL